MVAALGLGAVLAVPALPASAQSISIPNLNALTNNINHAEMLTYYRGTRRSVGDRNPR